MYPTLNLVFGPVGLLIIIVLLLSVLVKTGMAILTSEQATTNTHKFRLKPLGINARVTLSNLARLMPLRKDPNRANGLRRAGLKNPVAPQLFQVAQFALLLLGLVIGIIMAISQLNNSSFSASACLGWLILPAGVGFFAPHAWLWYRTQNILSKFKRGFPETLDMMVVCQHNGADFSKSIKMVRDRLMIEGSPLAAPFEELSLSLQSESDIGQAMESWANYMGSQDTKVLAKLISQQAPDMVHLADQMTLMSSELRRQQAAQKKKYLNEMPGKISMTALLFTVPTVFWILCGPAILAWF